MKIVQPLGDAIQIADAVAVGVLKASGVDLVDDGMFPPGSVGRMSRGFGRGPPTKLLRLS